MTSQITLATASSLWGDLVIAKNLVYEKCGIQLTALTLDNESQKYGACSFKLNGMVIIHRASKITPTKAGQFVTIWRRNANRETAPFDNADKFDFVVITARSGDRLGQFIFPKSVLLDNKVISGTGSGGKRGIRVYPPWDKTSSSQAEKTQNWQVDYFLTISNSTSFARAKRLLQMY